MPKDYAKKKAPNKKRGASRKKKKKSVPLALWLFTVALVISFASGLIYLKWYKPHTDIKPKAKVTTTKKKVSKPTAQKQVKQEDDVPMYDLHQDLTNKKVEIPEEDLKIPDNIDKYYYSMPCGSFRELSRADELKARIAMTGNNSSIIAVQYKGETWHRVQLGPFNRKRNAESVRHRLRDNDIHGCIINRHFVNQAKKG